MEGIDIIEQFLMCVKLLIARERVTAPQVITIWALIQRIVRDPAVQDTGPKPSHAHLGFAIIGEFEEWLTRHSEAMEKQHRVALCVYGMIQLFKPSVNPLSLWTDYPEATSLVRVLDGYLTGLGGSAVDLTHFVYLRWRALVEGSLH
jgi:hypothetical protein